MRFKKKLYLLISTETLLNIKAMHPFTPFSLGHAPLYFDQLSKEVVARK